MASPIKSLSMKDFLPMLGARQARFREGAPTPAAADGATALARALHPIRQHLLVTAVTERGADCKSYRLIPDPSRGTAAPAYFNAGSYLTVFETVAGMPVTRAYSISSSPQNALDGFYELTIKRVDGGLLSNYILQNWEVGTQVETSAPAGTFWHQPLRDAETVIGLAGGSGITPFVSMANAIADGDADFRLVLLYGSRDEENILFRAELDAVAARTDRVQVIHVLSDPKGELPAGMEQGFLTADLIRKYAPAEAPYSVFLCGPQQMYAFVDQELETLGLARKFIRHELFGEPHDPASLPDYPANVPETVRITVTVQGSTRTFRCATADTVMQSLEKAGVAVPARCRSGQCGFCHSHLLAGKVYVPKQLEYRRLADYEFGCIHPCCSFPLSDLALEIPAAR